jgi:hypothetical protein
MVTERENDCNDLTLARGRAFDLLSADIPSEDIVVYNEISWGCGDI